MSHAHATLTPLTRLRLAQLIVDDGWTYAAAKMFMVDEGTVHELLPPELPAAAQEGSGLYPFELSALVHRESTDFLFAAAQRDTVADGENLIMRWHPGVEGPRRAAARPSAASRVHDPRRRCRSAAARGGGRADRDSLARRVGACAQRPADPLARLRGDGCRPLRSMRCSPSSASRITRRCVADRSRRSTHSR